MVVSQPDNLLAANAAEPVQLEGGAPAFSVDTQWIRNSNGLRFDAAHYNPTLAKAIALLRGSGMELRPLGDVTERVFIPPRFKRVYVSARHGVPFLQGSHLVHFQPADLKYLSLSAHKNVDKWIIRQGWVLVTCSGTIGRVTIAQRQWEGWAASQHILRIIPRDDGECPPGYLLAFLRSFAGQSQLTSHAYGAVVDELTEGQTRGILVPIAKTPAQRAAVRKINETELEAMRIKEEAVDAAMAAERGISDLLGEHPDD